MKKRNRMKQRISLSQIWERFGTKQKGQTEMEEMSTKEQMNTVETKTQISPPWIEYVSEVQALFGEDPEIQIDYDNDAKVLALLVDNQVKADAIAELLPLAKEFGNVTLQIKVIPGNNNNNAGALLNAAFAGNPVLNKVQVVKGPFGNEVTYAVFAKKVVQFFDDNMADLNGNRSTLYENIARDVFGNVDAFFCTDIK